MNTRTGRPIPLFLTALVAFFSAPLRWPSRAVATLMRTARHRITTRGRRRSIALREDMRRLWRTAISGLASQSSA